MSFSWTEKPSNRRNLFHKILFLRSSVLLMRSHSSPYVIVSHQRLQENTRLSIDKVAVVMITTEVHWQQLRGNIQIGCVDLLTRTKTIPLLLKAKERGEYPRTWRPGNNGCPFFSPPVFSRAYSKISTFFTLKCRCLQQLYSYFEGKIFSMPTNGP